MLSRKKRKADKIKIAHVTGWLHFGGKENGIVNLVNALDPDVFENYIFTFVRDGAFTERIDPQRCRVVELGDKLGGDYKLYFKLARQFRRHGIHIAHTHSWSTLLEGVIGAKMAFVPTVVAARPHRGHESVAVVQAVGSLGGNPSASS